MFDLASLDTKTRVETGAPMTVMNPHSGAPVLREDKQSITITLLGRASAAYQECGG